MDVRLVSEDLRRSFEEKLRTLRMEAENLSALSAGPQPDASLRLRQAFLTWHDDIERFLLTHLNNPPELPMSVRYRALIEGTVPADQMYRVVNGERQRILIQLSTVEQEVAANESVRGSTQPTGVPPEVVHDDGPPLVFISHSSQDKARFVVPFAEKLRANGVDAWLDRWEMLPGDSLVDRIFEEGIGRARAIIAVISQHSSTSKWVHEELNAATIRRIEGTTHLIAVRLDDAKIPTALQGIVWEEIDPEGDWNKGLERILRAIFRVPERPPLGPPPAFVRRAYGVEPSARSSTSVDVAKAAEVVSGVISHDSALAVVKLGITDDSYRIRMEEAVKGLTDATILKLSRDNYPWNVHPLPADQVPRLLQQRLESYDQDIVELAATIATGVYYGDAKHDNIWTRPITRVTRSIWDDEISGWQEVWERAARYPSLRLYYAAGVAAVAASREPLVGKLMELGPFEFLGRPEQDLGQLLFHYRVVEDELMSRLPKWEGTRLLHSLSLHLRTTTRPAFGELLDDTEFANAFERFEYLRSLLEVSRYGGSSLGEFAWHIANYRSKIQDRVRSEIVSSKQDWPLVKAGNFKGDYNDALASVDKLSESFRGGRYW